jgi:acyl-homoserine-lactone acylase
VTPDWVQNSNDSYWLSNPDAAPMANVSPLVGAVGTPQRLRTRSGIQEIRARLAGTDGRPGNRMGADDVRTSSFATGTSRACWSWTTSGRPVPLRRRD